MERVQYAKTHVNYSDVTFVDDYQLPIPGLSLVDINLHSSTSKSRINLPLLTGLLLSRYPQAIDPTTLHARGGFGHDPFHSYSMSIDVDSGTALSRWW